MPLGEQFRPQVAQARFDDPGTGGQQPQRDILKGSESTFHTNQEVYIALLGMTEMPKTPETMPDTFFLPPQITAEFGNALSLTLRDNREHAGHSMLSNGTLQFSEIVAGKEHSVIGDTGLTAIETILGGGNNEVLVYHTHPSQKFLALFDSPETFDVSKRNIFLPHLTQEGQFEDFRHSPDDISRRVALSQLSLMDAVVQSGGVSLIAKTNMARQSINPILSKLKALHDIKGIFKGSKNEHFYDGYIINWLKTVMYLEEKGYAYYFWKPVTSEVSDASTFHAFAQPYNLSKENIQLNKVTPENLAQGIQMRRLTVTPNLKAEFNLR